LVHKYSVMSDATPEKIGLSDIAPKRIRQVFEESDVTKKKNLMLEVLFSLAQMKDTVFARNREVQLYSMRRELRSIYRTLFGRFGLPNLLVQSACGILGQKESN
jgi:hypothetical protein